MATIKVPAETTYTVVYNHPNYRGRMYDPHMSETHYEIAHAVETATELLNQGYEVRIMERRGGKYIDTHEVIAEEKSRQLPRPSGRGS